MGEGYFEPGIGIPAGYPGPMTRRVLSVTRSRTGSDRPGYYPSVTRVVEERGTTLQQ